MGKKYGARHRLSPLQSEIIQSNKGQGKLYLVFGCSHIPFHDKNKFNLMLKFTDFIRPDGLIIAGDFLDFNALSKYETNKVSKTGISLQGEYEEGNKILDIFDSFDIKEKVYLWGNHENRYKKWLADVNNHKYGDVMNPNTELKLKERGFKIYDDYVNDFFPIGSLQVFHGDYYNVHVCKKSLDTYRRNTMFVHTHRVQYYREGDFASWNIGFMGNIKSSCFDYASRASKSKWSNAFAMVYLHKGRHYVDIIDFVGDSFVYGSVKFE